MDIVRVNETLIAIGDRFRVERGPRQLTAIATPEMMSDAVTAGHYKFTATPEMVLAAESLTNPVPYPANYAKNAVDKLGKPIIPGQEFTYLDWLGKHIFHVYEYCTEEWTGPNTIVTDENGQPIKDEEGKFVLELGPAWRRRGAHDEEVLAVAAAVQLAMQGAA